MLKQQIRYAVFLLSLMTGLAPVAMADDSPLTLKQAMTAAIEASGGEVIKTETTEFKGRAVFKIRLVKEGHVKDVLIDAKSGAVITPK
ncbi:PepSY domain-containing protein [Neptuniibacter sp. PT8_73]|uniref:PepSY domain-containing protein n=1 Tax=unclassified Neptuniibacter TaxID=2630693 RepID=UPI0039F6E98A